jgi:deoxyribose-phosphate aldolase
MKDVEGVVRAAKGAIVKVILENCFLNEEEKRRACEWIAQTGAHFVKTSTGYAAGGATVEDVRLMRETVAGKCEVKAAGGIRTMEDVLAMLRAGATRLGSTRSDQFVQAYWEMPEDKKKDFAEFLVPAV